MGVTNYNKETNVSKIKCDDSFKVKISLVAEPDIVSNPTDIVLILDKSTSMSGSPFANLKSGAKKFIDIIDEATDGTKDGQIGNGSKIGIVSFSTNATQNTQLITSVDELKDAIDALTTGGSTNHADGFTKAVNLFDPLSTNQKIMIMFTDGKTTTGSNPNVVATAAKTQGIIIYCIGLNGNGGIDVQALNDWASDPSSSYVAITPDDEELEKLFEDLAKNISKPGATKIKIDEKVKSCFKITEVSNPSKGTASITGPNELLWEIDKLGVNKSEGAFLEFTVQHIGPCTGMQEVNEFITYTDEEHNDVDFPNPIIEIECDDIIITEECPTPINVKFEGCQDSLEFNAGVVGMLHLGRILQLDVTLRGICPHKRVALAVILTEIDQYGIEHNRGLKTLTIPAHQRERCQDVTVKCLKFILPEDLDVSGAPTDTICNNRNFKVRFISNYIDTDFRCCDIVL